MGSIPYKGPQEEETKVEQTKMKTITAAALCTVALTVMAGVAPAALVMVVLPDL